MIQTVIPAQVNRQNLNDAITHLQSVETVWRGKRLHGEVGIKLKFVNGVAVQWEEIHAAVHKSDQDQ